jgi:thiol-disulfide isomerase/thioredoxin
MNTGTILKLRCFASLGLLLIVAATLWGDEPDSRLRTPGGPIATIHLKNGSYCTGALIDTQSGESLRWQGADFTSPFTFSIDAVNAVRFPVPEKLPQPEGDFCFELNGGDLLFGSLKSLDGEQVVVDATELGQLHVDRRIVRRMFRCADGDMVYFGPSGLQGWQAAIAGPAAFREEAGQLVAEQKGAAIRRDFAAPPLACFEFELSWTKRPDFDLAVGAGPDTRSAQRAFHFEVWDDKLIVRRATEHEADVASLQQIEPGPGRAHFSAFLDQQKGRIIVFSPAGEKLADLTVATGKPQPHGGIQLVNKSGDVRLERLRITRWNGNAPHPAAHDKARIHGPDGAVVYGELKSYDPVRAELVVAADSGEQRIPSSQAHDVFLSAPEQAAPSGVRVIHQSGLRVTGELAKVDDQGVWLKRPGIRETIVSPLAALHALTVLQNLVRAPESSGRSGRLELETARLSGCLVDGVEGDQGCLVWQPDFSSTASPLAPGISARILYRDPPPPTPVVRSTRILSAPNVRRPLSLLEMESKAMATARRARSSESVLHLRSGDTFSCTVTGIDEKGVEFKSAVSDSTFVPHAEIKVLELMPEAAPVAIDKVKKERLLTLPRMQRDNPPTQFIRAANGDYLRGRLISMDDKLLCVEVRLETRTLLRQNVARIIWLHPDELDPDAKPALDTPLGTRVQALPADGNRLTFLADKLEGSILSGRSDLLGNCRVDLNRIDQLLIGAAIEESASTLAFHQWKLTSAREPLPAPDGDGSDSEGLQSALVGKPAPDFELELLSGAKFRLSRERGSIVVLDFWASWCEPCLRTMPQVETVSQEFAGDGVKLISVNQQEMPERVRDVLERLKLKAAVALDREGLIGEKYGAITIPLTVIVDRDGNVARVFSGGDGTFAERLRTALQQVARGPQKSE